MNVISSNFWAKNAVGCAMIFAFCNYASEEVDLSKEPDWLIMIDKVGSFEDLPFEIMDDEGDEYYNEDLEYDTYNEGEEEEGGDAEMIMSKLFLPPERVALEKAARGQSENGNTHLSIHFKSFQSKYFSADSYTGPNDFALLQLETALDLGNKSSLG